MRSYLIVCLGWAIAMVCAGRVPRGDILNVAEQCEDSRREHCRLLYVEDGRVRFRAESGKARDLGPYLAQFSGSIPASRAPVREISLSGDRKLVVAWGFEARFRLLGPSFWLYFLGPGGRIVAQQQGDVILRFLKAGALFGTQSDMVAMTMQAEAAPALVTMVWRWAERGDPQMVLVQSGGIERVDSAPIPGIRLTSPEPSSDDGIRWQTYFYEWHEDGHRFTVRLER